MWKNSDPRTDINKRDVIVILKPGLNTAFETGIGYVETKNGWSIRTSFENHKLISETDKWDQDWLWCYAPKSSIG